MTLGTRPPRSAAPLALLILALAGPARAQQWSDEFDLSGVVGRIFSTAAYQGELVIGGYRGLQADNQNFGLVARFDGTSWGPLGSGIPGAGAFIDYDVRDFALYQGELVAAGTFSSAGGQAAASIAGFDGADWQPLGAGLELSFAATGSVFSLAVYQGELYASGQFDLAGGAPVQGIARWDGSSWRDVGGGFAPLGGGTPGYAWKLSVGPDDRLYAAGEFPSAGGVAGTTDLAVWDGQAWGSVGGGFTGFGAGVRDLAWYQGELWAVGSYDLVSGGGLDEKAAIWNGSSWRAAGNFPDSSVSTRIDAVEVFAGDLYVGGNIVSVDGLSLRRMARFDGSVWSSPGGIFADSINQFVFDLVAIGGVLYVGGEFNYVGYLPPGNEALVSNSIGVFDGASWAPVGTGFGLNREARSSLLWNGALVAVGPFYQAGSQLVSGVARFDGAGWEALGSYGGGQAAGAALFQGDLVIVGDFTSVDGVPTPASAARFDGQQWTALGSAGPENLVAAAEYQGELYAMADYGLWRFDGSAWSGVGQQLFGFPYALEVHDDQLFAGGSYFGQGNLFAWDGVALSVVGGGTDDAVRALTSFGSSLIVGGEFDTAGGVPASRLARWDGSSWSQLGSLTGTDVTALEVLRGELYVGGNLVVPGNPPNKYIAKLEGGALQALGSGMLGQPLTMTADEGRGQLWVGGIFLTAGGNVAHNFCVWDTGLGALSSAYCTAGTSASGCAASLSSAGVPSASAPTGFLLSATDVEGAKDGLFFFGTSGRQAAPWGNGTSYQCVVPPVARAGLLAGQGAAATCDGAFQQDLNALWCSTCPKPQTNPGAGAVLQAQLWYRDPQNTSNQTTSLSNALEVVVIP